MGACHVVTTGTAGKALCSRWGLKGGSEAHVSRWMQEGERGRAGGGHRGENKDSWKARHGLSPGGRG